jgi:hypothetical protein
MHISVSRRKKGSSAQMRTRAQHVAFSESCPWLQRPKENKNQPNITVVLAIGVPKDTVGEFRLPY